VSAVLPALVTRHDRERRRDATLGQRDPRVRRRSDGGADARHDFERHASGRQRVRLLAAPAEHERIAALEAHDTPPVPRVLDQQRVDLLLWQRVMAARLPGKDATRARRLAKQLPGHQAVVDDHLGAAKQFETAHGHESRIAGTRADQRDRS
jgi:hypothetical protein